MSRRVAALVVVLLGVFAVGAYAAYTSVIGFGEPDSIGVMAGRAVVAAQDQHSFHYRLHGTVHASGAALKDPASPFDGDATFALEGGLSKSAVTSALTVDNGGKRLTGSAQLGPRSLFVNVLGAWYGMNDKGLDYLQRQSAKQAEQRKPGLVEKYRQLKTFERTLDRLFNGEISSDGDGWRFQGKLDPDGIAALAVEEGEPVKADERQVLELLSDASTVSFAIGKDDSLPNELALTVRLDKDQIAKLGALDPGTPVGDQASGLDGLRIELNLSLSDWGKPVELKPPSNFKSFDELLGEFLGRR